MIPMARRNSTENTESQFQDGYEIELGHPIPGRILPPEAWVKTGIKRLPRSPDLSIVQVGLNAQLPLSWTSLREWTIS